MSIAESESSLHSMRIGFVKRRSALLIAVSLTVATIAVYWQAHSFDFVTMDDLVYVSDNPHVLTGINSGNLVWSVTTFHAGYWIPLTWLSFMLDAQIFGAHPGGYHVTNLLLHVINTLLVFALLSRATGSQARGAFVAALFALHPLHVESVAWVTERKDVLSTLFGLLSIDAYVRSATTGRRWELIFSFLLFVMSLASKPTLVTLPFVFLLLDFWPLMRFGTANSLQNSLGAAAILRKTPGTKEPQPSLQAIRRPSIVSLLTEKLPFLAASVAFSIVTFFAQRSIGAVESIEGHPLSARCLNAVVVYAAYLRKTVLPDDLAIFYPHPRDQLALSAVAVAAAVLLTITLAAVIWLRRFPYLFVGWCWYLGTLVPTIGIVQVGRQQMADRFTYFPSIGLFIAFVWFVADLAPAGFVRSRLLPAIGVAGLAGMAVICFVQVGYWQNSLTLFRHAIDCGQDSAISRSFLGSSLVASGHTDEGMAFLESAVAMQPNDHEFEFNLAVALQIRGQLDAAAKHYTEALRLHERDAGVHLNLGIILLKRHEYQAAKKNFLRSAELDPDEVKTYANLGKLCLETGQYSESLTYSKEALDIDPASIMAHHNLALALIALGRLDEAISQFQYLCSALPNDRETHLNLERALAMKRGTSNK